MTATRLKLSNIGQIKSVQMPSGWVAVQDNSQEGICAIGFRYMHKFCNPEQSKTEICLFYTGLPLSPEDSSIFRSYLAGPQGVLFSEDSGDGDEYGKWDLLQLKEALGNAKMNQVINKHAGDRGPNFHLRKLELITISGNAVLSMRGYYQDPETRAPHNEYWNILFDGKPDEIDCPVQEIFLRAENSEQLEKSSPLFQETLDSIEWVMTDAMKREIKHAPKNDHEMAKSIIERYLRIYSNEFFAEYLSASPDISKIYTLRQQTSELEQELADLSPENTKLIEKALFIYGPVTKQLRPKLI
jgi:hypothetical protein